MNRIPANILLIFQFLCFSYCNQIDNADQPSTRNMPVGNMNDSTLFTRVKQTRDFIGNLDTLENGYDSIQIRIWFGYAFLDSAQVFVIKKCNGKDWSGELLNIVYQRNEADSLIDVKKLTQRINPVSGWTNALKTLDEFGIMTLPDSENILGYPDLMDGDGTTFEIATKGKYRLYGYHGVDIAKQTIKEAQRVDQIERFIQNEFNFKKIR